MVHISNWQLLSNTLRGDLANKVPERWTKIDETFAEEGEANEIPSRSSFQRRTIVTILNVEFQLSTPFSSPIFVIALSSLAAGLIGQRDVPKNLAFIHRTRNERIRRKWKR